MNDPLSLLYSCQHELQRRLQYIIINKELDSEQLYQQQQGLTSCIEQLRSLLPCLGQLPPEQHRQLGSLLTALQSNIDQGRTSMLDLMEQLQQQLQQTPALAPATFEKNQASFLDLKA